MARPCVWVSDRRWQVPARVSYCPPRRPPEVDFVVYFFALFVFRSVLSKVAPMVEIYAFSELVRLVALFRRLFSVSRPPSPDGWIGRLLEGLVLMGAPACRMTGGNSRLSWGCCPSANGCFAAPLSALTSCAHFRFCISAGATSGLVGSGTRVERCRGKRRCNFCGDCDSCGAVWFLPPRLCDVCT